MSSQTTIIPALPGWNMLEPVVASDHKIVDFYRMPIIAWQIEVSRYADGSTITDVIALTIERESSTEMLERPDGRIVFPFDAAFDDWSDAIAYANEEWLKQEQP